jgi:hypothetical protein
MRPSLPVCPAEGRPRGSRTLLARLARQHDVPDPTGLCGVLVAARFWPNPAEVSEALQRLPHHARLRPPVQSLW